MIGTFGATFFSTCAFFSFQRMWHDGQDRLCINICPNQSGYSRIIDNEKWFFYNEKCLYGWYIFNPDHHITFFKGKNCTRGKESCSKKSGLHRCPFYTGLIMLQDPPAARTWPERNFSFFESQWVGPPFQMQLSSIMSTCFPKIVQDLCVYTHV